MAPYSFYKVYEVKQWTMQKYPRPPEQGWPEFSDFTITCVSCLIIYISNLLMNMLTYDFFYRTCKEKADEELRASKTLKACNSFFKAIYYICVVTWGYYLFKDEYFIPPMLLGKGQLNQIDKQFPYYVWPDTLKYYYLGTMGFHLFSMIQHTAHKARNDFMEMALHHGSTLFLYALSYYLNRVECGAIIMYLHDWADIPCSFVRCFSETVFVAPALISAALMVVFWFYTRLIVFP